MQKVFRFIKKRRNLRRLSVVWLFLVIIELFCPVFCDEPTFAANLNTEQAAVNYSIEKSEDNSQNSISAYDQQNFGEEKANCNDECLCHAMAVLSLNIVNLKDSFITREDIDFSYGEPVFNSLPPPYLPPKNS